MTMRRKGILVVGLVTAAAVIIGGVFLWRALYVDHPSSAQSSPEFNAALLAFDWSEDNADPMLGTNSEVVHKVRAMLAGLEAASRGDTGSGNQLRQVMKELTAALTRDKTSSLNPVEQDAIILYAMSGGNPGIARHVLSTSDLSTRRRALLDATLAYAEGNTPLAREKLASLRPEYFPPAISARLLLMSAKVQTDLPYGDRKRLLQKAAAVSIGTLVEEAATRRLVTLSGQAGEAADFLYWAQRYVRRFSRSLYGADFDRDLIKGIAVFEEKKMPLSKDELAWLLNGMAQARQRAMVETLLRIALRKGYTDICEKILPVGEHWADVPESSIQRLRLYAQACLVGRQSIEESDVAKIRDESFDAEERNLLAQLRALTSPGSASVPTAAAAYGPGLPYQGFMQVHALGDSVTQALSATNETMNLVGQ